MPFPLCSTSKIEYSRFDFLFHLYRHPIPSNLIIFKFSPLPIKKLTKTLIIFTHYDFVYPLQNQIHWDITK